MFIKNTWYAAGWSNGFDRELRSLMILGEQVVIFRKENGDPVALEDACPHRKLPLSKGCVAGDTVVCGYHGLTFDGSGQCVEAPTQKELIPKRARVHSYPVEDRYGMLWIWMGEPSLADQDKIFHIPNFDNPTWGKTECGAMDIACHYLYITDNLLDPSHVAWVHLSSFAGAGTDDGPLDIEVLDNGVLVSRWVYDQAPPPYYADLLPFSGSCDRKQHYECQLPAIAINKSVYAPAGLGVSDDCSPENTFINISYNFMTPVDEDNSRYFWFQHRNMFADDEAMSAKMFAGAKMAFQEDREVLTRVHTGMKHKRTPNINLKLDLGAVRFRTLVDQRVAVEQAVQS